MFVRPLDSTRPSRTPLINERDCLALTRCAKLTRIQLINIREVRQIGAIASSGGWKASHTRGREGKEGSTGETLSVQSGDVAHRGQLTQVSRRIIPLSIWGNIWHICLFLNVLLVF